jgi:hypothetical protein
MSYSGRVTVVNSLLTSIATFTMFSIKINPKILEIVAKNKKTLLMKQKNQKMERNVILWQHGIWCVNQRTRVG